MAVTLGHEALAHLDAAGLAHVADVVAAQVDQHQVLGALLGVGQQFRLQGQVLGRRRTARARARDRAHRHLAALQPHQDLRRRAHHLGAAGIEEVHVGRGIHRPQRAVHVHRSGIERHAHALRQHHLEGIARGDVVLGARDRRQEALAGEARLEMRLVHGFGAQRLRIAGAAVAQAVGQRVEASAGAREGLRLARVGMHDQVQPALEVVEHRDFLAEHQQDVGRAELVGIGVGAQARLDVLDALEAEPADQAAAEAGQARQARHRMLGAQAFDLGERVGHLARLHRLAVLADSQAVAAEAEDAPGWQADDRIAAEALAALDGFEQVGMRPVGELEVDRQRGVEVGQDLAHDGDAGVAFSGRLLEFFLRGHAAFPWNADGRERRWRATIASLRRQLGNAEVRTRPCGLM